MLFSVGSTPLVYGLLSALQRQLRKRRFPCRKTPLADIFNVVFTLLISAALVCHNSHNLSTNYFILIILYKINYLKSLGISTVMYKKNLCMTCV